MEKNREPMRASECVSKRKSGRGRVVSKQEKRERECIK